MKTRFSALVQLKKDTMQKSERALERANTDLNSAKKALDLAYESLQDIELPSSGAVSNFLAHKTLLESTRLLIRKNQEWVEFTQQQAYLAKQQLQKDMIEYEKFKYLEAEELKKIQQAKEKLQAKELDEIALMGFANRKLV